jgi:hypothetical protein
LCRIYTRIQSREPQERCAHWRSIAYTHAIMLWQDDTYLKTATTRAIENISKVLSLLSDGIETKLPQDFWNLAFKLFQSAAELQTKAKTSYVSFDYGISFQSSGKDFESGWMEVSQGGATAAKTVWLTVGLGMTAMRNTLTEGKDSLLESTCAVKASVVCDNWDPDV